MCKFIFNCEKVELEKQSLKGDFKAILFNKPGKEELIKVKKKTDIVINYKSKSEDGFFMMTMNICKAKNKLLETLPS